MQLINHNFCCRMTFTGTENNFSLLRMQRSLSVFPYTESQLNEHSHCRKGKRKSKLHNDMLIQKCNYSIGIGISRCNEFCLLV